MSVDYVTVYLPTTKGSEMTTLAEDYNTRTNLSTNLYEIFDTALAVKELWERNVSTNKWDLEGLEVLLCVGGPTQTLLIRHEFTTLTTYWGGDTHEIVTTTSDDWSAELRAIESSVWDFTYFEVFDYVTEVGRANSPTFNYINSGI